MEEEERKRAALPETPRHIRGWGWSLLDQSQGACHIHPVVIPVSGRTAASYAHDSTTRYLHLSRLIRLHALCVETALRSSAGWHWALRWTRRSGKSADRACRVVGGRHKRNNKSRPLRPQLGPGRAARQMPFGWSEPAQGPTPLLLSSGVRRNIVRWPLRP